MGRFSDVVMGGYKRYAMRKGRGKGNIRISLGRNCPLHEISRSLCVLTEASRDMRPPQSNWYAKIKIIIVVYLGW